MRFLKMGVPQMDGLHGKITLKWMIWGYPYFRKPPYISYGLQLSRLDGISGCNYPWLLVLQTLHAHIPDNFWHGWWFQVKWSSQDFPKVEETSCQTFKILNDQRVIFLRLLWALFKTPCHSVILVILWVRCSWIATIHNILNINTMKTPYKKHK